MRKICFVCLGNICRSPMAEFVMKDLLVKTGRAAEFEIASRATGTWEHGNPIHKGTQAVFAAHKILWDRAKTSQMISSRDFERFDEIIAMDDQNVLDLKRLAPAGTSEKIEKLRAKDVPDPWYTGDFEETHRLIKLGCEELLKSRC